jgi:Ras-related protein Rab-32
MEIKYKQNIIDNEDKNNITYENTELLYKILIIGDVGVGKTSIIKRYVHNIFSYVSKPTIGIDFALKEIKLDDHTNIKLQLWDISGQERFRNMTRVYYKEAVGAFIVFDISRFNTFDAVDKWKLDLDKKVFLPNSELPIPTILLANKIDLLSEDDEEYQKIIGNMDTYCTNNGCIGWVEISAKNNTNIDMAVNKLITQIYEKLDKLHIDDTIVNDLNEIEPETGCC